MIRFEKLPIDQLPVECGLLGEGPIQIAPRLAPPIRNSHGELRQGLVDSDLPVTSRAQPVDGVLGIDVGGANLKFYCRQQAASCVFPMWKEWRELSDRVTAALDRLPQSPAAMAITMTGELADCFPTRRAGVEHILGQLAKAYPVERCWVYSVDGQWLPPSEARDRPWDVAASNWHALASWIGRWLRTPDDGCDLIVDIGSTTVDIIPVRGGRVATFARTDRQRMELGQLVYTGYERTPIRAITDQVILQGRSCPLMAERFADSLDAYLALGLAPEDATNLDTADARPRTRDCALARMARMVGEDSESLSVGEIESIAAQVIAAQTQAVVQAILRQLPATSRRRPVIVAAGHGQHLLESVQALLADRANWIQLADQLGPAGSRNASAIAVAAQLELAFASTSLGE